MTQFVRTTAIFDRIYVIKFLYCYNIKIFHGALAATGMTRHHYHDNHRHHHHLFAQ